MSTAVCSCRERNPRSASGTVAHALRIGQDVCWAVVRLAFCARKVAVADRSLAAHYVETSGLRRARNHPNPMSCAPMRLLFVIGNLSDYHVPRYEALAELATARGHELSLVEVFGRSSVYRFPQDRRAAFFHSAPSNVLTLIEDAGDADGHWPLVSARLLAALRRCAPDVVVTLGYNTSYSLLLLALKLIRKRFSLIYMSDSKADDGRRFAVKERLKRSLVSKFDAALVAGEKHRRYAQSLGIPMTRSRIGFDVIDVDYFAQAARAALTSEPEIRDKFALPARYIVCVSRFVQRKNIHLLIDAYCQSCVHKSGLSLVLVGQGPDEHAIREHIERRGMKDQIAIIDSVTNADMPGLYALAEFIVLASAFDQWGLCISEAFAAGKPAIVTRTCGVAHELVVDDVNGFVVEPGDTSALSERMVWLATNAQLRTRLAQAAQASVRHWTPALFAKNVIELAEQLTGATVRPRAAAVES
jgi:glycosyltransferase involved in cell wall biosynthesis